ncbi:hypothetical protein KP509_13G006700 [Ceratopteris richardii]|uniref:ribonuclease P n=1 Tax=Ceratopteris richardii TaxID=49495 RepID=A0A8T2TF03_CERRI|nr:hypothetical protein KP509_13G006700 [Ceratopteris richardii]
MMELQSYTLCEEHTEVCILVSLAGISRVNYRTAFWRFVHASLPLKSNFTAQVSASRSFGSRLFLSGGFSCLPRESPSLQHSDGTPFIFKPETHGTSSVPDRHQSYASIFNGSNDNEIASSHDRFLLDSKSERYKNLYARKRFTKHLSLRGCRSCQQPSKRAKTNPTISTINNRDSLCRKYSGNGLIWLKDFETVSNTGPSSVHKRSNLSSPWRKISTDEYNSLDSSPTDSEEASSCRFCATLKNRAPRKSTSLDLSKVQTQEEEIKCKKERIAMEEANGFRLSKRAKKNPEEINHILKLNQCSKHGDLHGALKIYDTVKKGKLFSFKLHHYNILLYICSTAASGIISKKCKGKVDKQLVSVVDDTNKCVGRESKVSREEPSHCEPMKTGDVDVVYFSTEDRELAVKRGTEIYEEMIQANVSPNEATFTAVARLAVAKGDGDLAFETVQKMAAAGIPPKLRSYGPPLLCFCEHKQVEKAFEVDYHMAAAGISPDENLLDALLKLSLSAGLESKVYNLLHRLRKTVRDVAPTTSMTIEKWFNSKAAESATFNECKCVPSKEDIKEAAESKGGGWHGLGWLGKGKWITRKANVTKAGVCESCGEALCAIDLDSEETEKFAKSVAELAMQRENNANEFVKFQEWLEKNGPFEVILDGANIGMYNSALRGFNYSQVATVVGAIKERSLVKKSPLIVLHCRRTSDGASSSPLSQNIINEWINENALYATPHGSNDDWYWLYAAVKFKCLLVTNDEMRDHLFELLGNNFFPKWKERHQVHFSFSDNGLDLLMPLPYSTVIQESQSGKWHIPVSGTGINAESSREWLCVTRTGMDSCQ